jgi:transcriptional regulator with XRE-family HTH domain
VGVSKNYRAGNLIHMREARKKPRELTSSWPDVASPDYVGETARLFALNLRDAIGSRSIRAVAADSGLSHATISLILAGELYPDLTSLARLEHGLKTDLWPRFLGVAVAV